MHQPFEKSMRSIVRDRSRVAPWLLAISVVLIAGWATWMYLARVTVVVISTSARVETVDAPHFLEAPISGRIERVAVGLDQNVARGDILFEIDTEERRLSADELTSQIDAIDGEIDALDAVMETSARVTTEECNVLDAEKAGAEAERDSVAARGRLLAAELDRIEKLGSDALVSRAATEKAKSSLEQANADERRAQQSILRSQFRARQAVVEGEARIEALRRERAALTGKRVTLTATRRRLTHEANQGDVLAPIDGRTGNLSHLKPGSYVEAGDELTTLVPTGELRVVAYFRPEASVGRIEAGQHARLRLDAYPWVEYGTVTGRIEHVGSEIDPDGVRVEIGHLDPSNAGIVMKHGLTGTLEVEVERASPLALILRRIGAITRRD